MQKIQCDNWHDTVRLVLLRYLGVQRRDVRRWLLKRIERAHWRASDWEFYWFSGSASFHDCCKRRLLLMERPDNIMKGLDFDVYFDAENIHLRNKLWLQKYGTARTK